MLKSPLRAYRVSLTVRARSYGSATRRPDSHRVANVRERVRGDRPGLLGAGGEHRLDCGLVGPQLGVALANRRQIIDHGVRDGALEVPVPRTVELALDLTWIHATDH